MHKQNGQTPSYKQSNTDRDEMSDHIEFSMMDDADRLYREGYQARSIEECPYPIVSQGPYVIWMQGYSQHQRDREKIAEYAARPYCKSPLVIGGYR